MKLLLDHNISPKLLRDLEAHYPGSGHVRFMKMAEARDDVIWNFAKSNAFVIVTRDSDYFDLSLERGAPPYVLLLDFDNPSTDVVRRTLLAVASRLEHLFLEQNLGCVRATSIGPRPA